MLKKTLSIILSLLLLLSLTACGGGLACDPLPLPEDADYHYGMEQLELGNLAKAYGYFQSSADPKAAEMLEKFVFVPTTVTRKNSNGRDLVHTFTYNEQGNLLSAVDKGDYSWTMETDSAVTYTYDEHNRKLTYTYLSEGEAQIVETYVYDNKGNVLTQTEHDVDGVLVARIDSTYDEQGHLLTRRRWFSEERTNSSDYEVFTYDEQDRVLTCTITYEDREPTVYTYVYAEDGSYHKSYNGPVYAYTYWYDKEGRTVKHEVVVTETDEVKEYSETRYDEMGHQVYYCEEYYGSGYVKTTTYNEQGLELTSQTLHDGELYSMTTYTYDEKGNELTYEYFYGNTTWGRNTYTYDEQNRLLTKKAMNNTGWHQYAYTYDEAGYCIKVEQDGADEDYVCESTRDAYGNILTYTYTKEDPDGGLYVEQAEAQWVLQYYPDGTPEELEQALISAETWFQYAQD